ncbi:MAG: nuclear transport factor 2 family protein [Rhodobacteraceae bacterium]|nr:nuclear transport factor 2 family protein [Paracoccaceae bacterium]MBR9821020.1 nuclear transport factor 2 family protein [Paracoccaceae bacterium]
MEEYRELLADLKAREDIRALMARYCHGIDRCDAEMVKSCFFEDAIDDHGFFVGSAHVFADQAVQRLVDLYDNTCHHMTTHLAVIDGEVAHCETYILALSRAERDGRRFDVTFSARYLDRVERRDGAWRIAHRILVDDGRRSDPLPEETPPAAVVKRGGRAPDDPGHVFLQDAHRQTGEST